MYIAESHLAPRRVMNIALLSGRSPADFISRLRFSIRRLRFSVSRLRFAWVSPGYCVESQLSSFKEKEKKKFESEAESELMYACDNQMKQSVCWEERGRERRETGTQLYLFLKRITTM